MMDDKARSVRVLQTEHFPFGVLAELPDDILQNGSDLFDNERPAPALLGVDTAVRKEMYRTGKALAYDIALYPDPAGTADGGVPNEEE